MGKGLLDKLKLGFASAGLASFLYFNSATAQFPFFNKSLFLQEIIKKEQDKDYKTKYNTVAHQMLMIEDSGIVGAYPSLKKLDEAIDLSKKFIKKTRYTKQELSDLSKKIYLIINGTDYFLAHDYDEGEFFSVLPTCYIYSLYYLAIGQANNLPFYAVNFEKNLEDALGHIFIRYDPDGKHDVLNPENPVNKGDINLEATTGEIQNKGEYSDNYYIDKYNIQDISLKNRTALENLDEKKLLGLSYIWRATKTSLYARGIREDSEEELEEEIKKCESYKDLFYGHTLLATKNQIKKCLENKNIEHRKDSIKEEHLNLTNKAFEDYNKAIELNPNSFIAYYCKGASYQLLCSGHFGVPDNEEDKNLMLKAIENYIKAAEISPNPEIYKKIASNYYNLGKEGCYKDIEYIAKAINLMNENIKKEKNLEKTKDLKNKLKELEESKKHIEKSHKYSKYNFNCCDKIKNSK
ncbi:hypothetical protein HYT91_03085 [Candidatus Pacearchaeota archaeon]|nr:hypothetical protein [Candidatus Pacearchaeota archaeon]